MLYDHKIFSADPKRSLRKHENESIYYRTEFERDRDRILYCRPFRRLSGKTQVFIPRYNDHARTRLTHTLEVSQIATNIARALNLNPMLCESIALGHDIGHSPFGHAGEDELNRIMNGCESVLKEFTSVNDLSLKGFKHNWQSVRNLVDLANLYPAYTGLNLTYETIWGVLKHTSISSKPKSCPYFDDAHNEDCLLRGQKKDCNNRGQRKFTYYENKYSNYSNPNFWTVEALIVAHADEIAQVHHDIEDAFFAKVLEKDRIMKILKEFSPYFDENHSELFKNAENFDEYYPLYLSKLIVSFLVEYYIESLNIKLNQVKSKFEVKSSVSFYKNKSDIYNGGFKNFVPYRNIKKIDPDTEKLDVIFSIVGKKLKSVFLNSHLTQRMDGRSRFIIRQLYRAFLTNPQQLADGSIIKLYMRELKDAFINRQIKRNGKVVEWDSISKSSNFDLRKSIVTDMKDTEFKKGLIRVICDHIAGMTDEYALKSYQSLYGVNVDIYD
jgi:dGTPase